jgi:glycosyltransferase involved in cell wall biosynthesis
MKPPKPQVSVVIPAYNEAENIGALLASLAGQTFAEPFEVIVADNNSTDQTVQVAETFADRLRLRVIIEHTKGRGAARAAGFAAAGGSIVLSTDADSAVPSNWTRRLVAALRQPGVVAVTGPGRITDCTPAINRRFNRLQPWLMRAYRLVFGHYWLTGFNFGITRAAYDQAGGFAAGAADLEDIDLGFRVHRVGRIVMVADVPVTTSGRRFRRGLLAGLWPYTWIFIRRFWFRSTTASRD